jgi:hypothetical protein
MKSNVMSSMIHMEENELQKLVAEVKETVATNVDVNKGKKETPFVAASLWNVQKQMKPALRSKLTDRWGL